MLVQKSPFGIVRFVVPYGGITEDQVRYGFIGCVNIIVCCRRKVNTWEACFVCNHLWAKIGQVSICRKCKLQKLADGTLFIEKPKKGTKGKKKREKHS